MPLERIQTLAVASEEDPVLPVYRQWLAKSLEWVRLAALPENEDYDTPEILAVEAERMAAFRALIAATPRTMEGIAALAHVMWDYTGPSAADPVARQKELEQPGNKLIAAIWRGATGRDDFPQG